MCLCFTPCSEGTNDSLVLEASSLFQRLAETCHHDRSTFFVGVLLASEGLTQWSPTFLTPGTGFVEDSFSMDWEERDGVGMIQVHCISCTLYFYYYYIVTYNEILLQLTIMQNQWEL